MVENIFCAVDIVIYNEMCMIYRILSLQNVDFGTAKVEKYIL